MKKFKYKGLTIGIILIFMLCIACLLTQQNEQSVNKKTVFDNSIDKDNVVNKATSSNLIPIKIPTEDEVIKAYKESLEPYYWLSIASLETDMEDKREYDGNIFNKVKKFETMADFKSYLSKIFSEELIQAFLSNKIYVEIDGKLYGLDAARGTDISKGMETYTVEYETNEKIKLIVTVEILDLSNPEKVEVTGSENYDFYYELINGKWVFTTYPNIR